MLREKVSPLWTASELTLAQAGPPPPPMFPGVAKLLAQQPAAASVQVMLVAQPAVPLMQIDADSAPVSAATFGKMSKPVIVKSSAAIEDTKASLVELTLDAPVPKPR